MAADWFNRWNKKQTAVSHSLRAEGEQPGTRCEMSGACGIAAARRHLQRG